MSLVRQVGDPVDAGSPATYINEWMSLVRQVGDPVDAGSPATYIDERVPHIRHKWRSGGHLCSHNSSV